MAHIHPVPDTDPSFVIDPQTRNIANLSGKNILVQNDHNSERFTFAIPRYVDGHDMSLCNVVQVHYINSDSSRRYQNTDVYTVTDLAVAEKEEGEEEELVTGSWLISGNATSFNGSLDFVIRFACVTKSVIDYQWFTNICSLIKVEKGIYNAESVTNFEDTDLLDQWRRDILEAAMIQTTSLLKEANYTLDELNKKITETVFTVNWETGELEYTSPNYIFTINVDTGNLEWEVA